MATRAQNTVVYGAAAVQGIVLVTFPAASTILTEPDYYDLSNTRYGSLFLPQVELAVATSPTLNSLTAAFHPGRVDASVLAITSAVLLAGLIAVSLGLDGGVRLSTVYLAAAAVAAAMGLLSFVVTRRLRDAAATP